MEPLAVLKRWKIQKVLVVGGRSQSLLCWKMPHLGFCCFLGFWSKGGLISSKKKPLSGGTSLPQLAKN